jgi:hypothetical protein
MKMMTKQQMIDHIVATKLIAQNVARTTTDQTVKRAARMLVRDINESLDRGAIMTDWKRITRAVYRLIACVNGGIAA